MANFVDILGEIECWSKEEGKVSVFWCIQKLLLYMQTFQLLIG